MAKVFELIPANGGKSFYGKCRVRQNDNVSELESFTTIVASFNHKTKTMTVNGWYSAATATHINAFLELQGLPRCTKKQLQNYNK